MTTPSIVWSISSVECCPEFNGQQNVVTTVHWCCQASDQGKAADVCASTPLDVDSIDGNSFTSFDQLSKEQVLGWVWSKVNRSAVEASVQKAFNDLIKPETVCLQPHWLCHEI